MNPIQTIEARRQAILEEMNSIRRVVRGTFKEQMLPVPHRGKKQPVLRGPYFLLARWEHGKTRSRRIPLQEVAFVKEGAENYKRLKELCEQFAALTERLGELERQNAASQEAVKKGLKSQPNSPRK
jgi:hypothetical protein